MMKAEYLLFGTASGLALWLWYDSLKNERALTRGSAVLRSSIPYRFTYQTTEPIVGAAGNLVALDRQQKIRLQLVHSSAYGIEFLQRPGLVGGEYLLRFTAAPPKDVSATIGSPLNAEVPSLAYDLKLVTVERLDGQPL